jgi:type I restriction enzyme R subunit
MEALGRLSSLDIWYLFKARLKKFSSIFNSLSPDPCVLDYKDDLKWLAVVYSQGKLKYEPLDESIDYREYGAKVKEIIDEHLVATGLKKLVKLKDLSDPDFFKLDDSITPEQNTLKKSTSIKRILRVKIERNPIIYKKFSDYLEKLLKDFEENRVEFADRIRRLDELAREIAKAEEGVEEEGLNRNAGSFMHLLEEDANFEVVSKDDLKEKAMEIDELFETNPNACYEWQKKDDSIRELKKEIKRKTIGVVKDREGFVNKVIEYAKKNYFKDDRYRYWKGNVFEYRKSDNTLYPIGE